MHMTNDCHCPRLLVGHEANCAYIAAKYRGLAKPVSWAGVADKIATVANAVVPKTVDGSAGGAGPAGGAGQFSDDVDGWIQSLGPHVESWIRMLPREVVTKLRRIDPQVIKDFDNGKIPSWNVPLSLKSARKNGLDILKRKLEEGNSLDKLLGSHFFKVKTATWEKLGRRIGLKVVGEVEIGPVGTKKIPTEFSLLLNQHNDYDMMSFLKSVAIEAWGFTSTDLSYLAPEERENVFSQKNLDSIGGTVLKIHHSRVGTMNKFGVPVLHSTRFSPSGLSKLGKGKENDNHIQP